MIVPRRLVGPTLEPVALAEAKRAARIDADIAAFDAEVATLISVMAAL